MKQTMNEAFDELNRAMAECRRELARMLMYPVIVIKVLTDRWIFGTKKDA